MHDLVYGLLGTPFLLGIWVNKTNKNTQFECCAIVMVHPALLCYIWGGPQH